ncbi:AAA family ATPase [Actinoplanes sp. NPDC024001]|uniref:helix-turn-helix transcriptional regulator n=1 Tax=Actinoplanes sp. NPDC024001 TaxID=3154598 RepID=UPI0033F9E329
MTGTPWGREAELSVLAGGLAAAASGAGRLLVVEGPAGIGKTTLLDAAAARAADHGMTVLRARGNPLEQDFAFGIARQVFAPVRATDGWAAICRGPAEPADRVLTADPPVTGHDVEAMYAAAHGLFWLTAHHAGRTPAVLCVDDVHWADAPSLRWLVGLARRIDELPIVAILAASTGEPAADPRILGELTATATPVRPRPLDPASAARLIGSALPGATPGFARACHAATGGNPFLLSVLLSEVRANGATPDDDGVTALGTGPDRVHRWVEQHLRRFPGGAVDLARALAVLGPAATLRHAAALAGLPVDRAAVLTDAMRASGLLSADAAPVLAHPIVATALYDGMGPGLRGVLHSRAARLLAATNAGDPERAALHLLHAEPVGDDFAIGLLRAAARHATSRGAPEVAVTFLRRALNEPPAERHTETAIRLDLALALAAGRQAGANELARRLVAGIDAPADRADAALRCGRALALTGDQPAAIDLYRLVLDRPAGVPPDTLARIEAEWAANAWTDSRTRPAAGALARARLATRSPAAPARPAAETPAARAAAETPATFAARPAAEISPAARAWQVDGPPELWRVAAVAEATFAGWPPGECLALLAPLLDTGALAAETDSLLPTAAAVMLTAGGHLDRALALADGMIADGRARGWPSTVAHGGFLRALALLPAGAVSEAATEARAALDFKIATGTTPAAAMLWALTPLIEALVEADRAAGAETVIASAGLGEPPAHALTAPMFLQSRARLRMAQGRPGPALDDLLDAAARWAELDISHPVLVCWPAGAVRAYLAMNRPDRARRTAETYLESALRTGAPEAIGAALRASALVSAGADRIALLERAVQATGDGPGRLQYAYALHDLGGALRRANRRGEAREPLRAALEIADAGGAARLAGRALAELRAAGARPRRTARHGMDALTDAERAVVGLATRGLTNRQISEQLTLSRRTVETHLAHAYQKLEIHSRAELAGVTASPR